MKNSNTSSGIEPATFRFVAQNLKRLRYRLLFKKTLSENFLTAEKILVLSYCESNPVLT